jgi:hypothetical protein
MKLNKIISIEMSDIDLRRSFDRSGIVSMTTAEAEVKDWL